MIRFVLGSGSASRLELLRKSGFIPDVTVGANIDETPCRREKPRDYVSRIAKQKAESLHQQYFGDIILCCDTIASCKSMIIQKCKTDDEIRRNLDLYSGKSVKILTSICLINEKHSLIQKTVESSIKYKHMSHEDKETYIQSKEGIDKAGGIAVEGLMDCFILKIVGSYSNIIGLPMYVVSNMLISNGVKRQNIK